MSEHETPEFRAVVAADGNVLVPASYLKKVGFEPGSMVTVRVTELLLSEALRARGITEQEVDRIGATQLESRENVLAFLSSEGALAGDPQGASALRARLSSGE